MLTIILKFKKMNYQPSILVIDDETLICESCSRIFSQAGYKVDTYVNSDNGFRQAISYDYDAIVLDLNLGKNDGMDLLRNFRKIKPKVPVVIITGYPTEESKKMSDELGVSDYILKPFEPGEILEPIQKVTFRKPQASNESIYTQHTQDDNKTKDYYRFFESSWLYRESGGLIRIGGHLINSLNISPESVTLPDPGSIVYRGLPLAVVNFGNGVTLDIPSALSGKITVVNSELIKFPSILENNINKESWIALVKPENIEEEIKASEIRKILILSKDGNKINSYCNRIRNMGYIALITKSIEKAMNILDDDKINVAIVDAATFKDKGPDNVKRIYQECHNTKVIVINNPNSEFETEYRKNRIFYYGVNPVSNKEIADVLSCAFNNERRIELLESDEPCLLPKTISKISITNRHSKKVTLLAYDDILQNNQGIGYLVIRKLIEQAYPVEVLNSWARKSLSDTTESYYISNEKEKNDCIIIIHSQDMQRIPGNITKISEVYENSTGTKNITITISVQPPVNSNKIIFNNITTRSLAELIINEMISV